MTKNNKSGWIIVAVIAAIIAAITTLVVLALRARAKSKPWYEQEAFDYDEDDCAGFEDEDSELAASTEEAYQE